MNGRLATLAFGGVSLLLCIAAFALAARGQVQHQSFKAFYCAGAAVREKRDPYRVEPLRSCERAFETTAMPQGYVEPAPLPGYALAAFAALSLLPPRLAAELFAVLLAAAVVLAARCMAASLPGRAWAILLAFVPLTLLNVAYGEVPPLATLALCASGFFLSQRRGHAAGIAAACAMIAPNVGVPAALALFVFAPRTRVAIVLSALALGAISLAALGPAINLEYFRAVLPAMAHAEIVASDQYSLARLLYAAGVTENAALAAGQIWYVCVTIAGIALAQRIASTMQRPEVLALLPPAAALFFGIYLHDVQLIVALPAALVVSAVAPSGFPRAVATAGLALLTPVWTQPARSAVLALNAIGVAGAIFAVRTGSVAARAIVSTGVAAAVAALIVFVQHAAPGLTANQIATHDFYALPSDLSAAAWAEYLRATPALTRAAFAPQAAAWAGLLGTLAAAIAMAFTPVRSEWRAPPPGSAPCNES